MAVAPQMGADAPPYLDFFQLKEAPFQITPSERFTYLTLSTREAIVHGQHVVAQRRGLAGVEGEIGTGKTTLAQKIARDEQAAGNEVAFLHYVPGGVRQTESKVYTAIAHDLQLPVQRNAEKTLHSITEKAIACRKAGKTLVVIVDDAHKSRGPAIAAYLALLNLQTEDAQLIQVLLFGEFPEMATILKTSRALHSRLSVLTRLNPLTPDDVKLMVEHRLRIAGRTAPLLDDGAIAALHDRSKGIPRIICTTANLACTFAWDEDRMMVTKADVVKAADRLKHNDE